MIFKDSGWYHVDFTKAEHLQWGYKKGCSFVEGSCSSWTTDLYRCDSPSDKSCNFDRRAKGVCAIANGQGTDKYADYCPYYVPVSNDKGWCGLPDNAPSKNVFD